MNKKELAPGIFVYSDVLDNSNALINDIEEGMKSSGISWVQSQVKQENDVKVDTNSRDTLTVTIPYTYQDISQSLNLEQAFNFSLSKLFFDGFSNLETDYKNHHTISTDWHDSYSILKYGAGQKFVNHIDDHKDYHRRISTVYYINDEYTGGEIVFPRFGITHKPKANELLIFPSTYVYNHSVLPVIEGTRYAVVSWLT